MWVAHSIVSFVLPLMAFSQDSQPCAEDHYHEQSYQSPRTQQQHIYGFDSCGGKVCASDGYRYASFDHICHLSEINMQLLIAEQPEFIETDPYYCEQQQRSLSYNRLPFPISSYSPYSPTVARESAVMQNIKYHANNIHLKYPTRNYYEHPISRSFEHAAAQTSAIVTTKLGQIGAQRTVYWRQPNQNQHHSYYDSTADQTLSNAYPSYTNLAASQYSVASSNINTYEPKVEPISPNTTTTSDPNTTATSTMNAPNTTTTSTTSAPNTTTTSTTVSPTPTAITTSTANTTATSTENRSTTEATSTTVSSSEEVNVTSPATTNTPDTTTISTTIIPNITTSLGGIDPVSPTATADPNPIISTTVAPSISTTISPNTTTTSTTTDLNTTTFSTTTAPNITTILTTISPNTTTIFTTTFPTTTISTTTSPTRIISTTATSTSTSPTTTISTTTIPTTTTVSPSTPTTTINATTTSTTISPTTTITPPTTIAADAAATIEPNTTSSTATSTTTTPPAAPTTTTSRLYYRNAMVTNSYNIIEPITITIQQSNGIVLSFVLTPLGADGAGYSTCNPTSTAQITKGPHMLFQFTGCSKTKSSSISKPTGSPISYPTEPASVPIYRSPPAPNTKRSPYYYNAAAASGATCAHSYASRIIYNY